MPVSSAEKECGWWQLREAARVLRGGGVVAHATEGVWGLACDPLDPSAVAKVLSLKHRDPGQGLILLGHRPNVFAQELAALNEAEHSRVLAAWPGASTFVVPNLRWPQWISGDHKGVAVRVSGHPQARALSARFGAPLVSTSANPGGRKAADNEMKVRAYFGCEIDFYLPGKVQQPGVPSSIHDFGSNQTLRGTDPSSVAEAQ